jgi:hypothetical protein
MLLKLFRDLLMIISTETRMRRVRISRGTSSLLARGSRSKRGNKT